MVLARRVGSKRSFGLGLFLTVVTFGIYAVYWNYRAHSELYRQFELARENRDEGVVWYVLGLVLAPFLLVYLWMFAANVAYLRERIGLRRSMSPGKLLAYVGIAVGVFAFALIALQIVLALTTAAAAVGTSVAIAILLILAAAVLFAVAYAGLQRDINEIWDAYQARMDYLARHPEEVRRPEMAAHQPAANPADLAAPLRREVTALRGAQPALRALDELDALLVRAESGEAEARERGETLLADVAALLQERAELLLRIQSNATGTDVEGHRERLAVIEQALFHPSA